MMRLLALSSSCLALLLLPVGCAHYYWPANNLESPESIGPERIGRLELIGIQSGTDLTTPPSQSTVNPKTKKAVGDTTLDPSWVNYAFGVSLGLTPQLDVGFKIQPFAPVLGRVKYQLLGQPESVANAGNFSLSGSATGGLLLSTYNGNGVTFYTGNAALITGWRFAQHHLLSLAPFLSLAGLSGTGDTSGNGMRYGGSLGYQYDAEALILRWELTWAMGTISQQSGTTANADGFFPGVLLGLKL